VATRALNAALRGGLESLQKQTFDAVMKLADECANVRRELDQLLDDLETAHMDTSSEAARQRVKRLMARTPAV
jgi:hypothetical protein